MQAIVYVDQAKYDELNKKLSIAHKKCQNTRSDDTYDHYAKMIEELRREISKLPQQLNPKFIEELLVELGIKIASLKQKIDENKTKFQQDPISFLEYDQIEFLTQMEQYNILHRLHNNILETQKAYTGNMQMGKIKELFDLYHSQMFNKILRWSNNPDNSTCKSTNLVESCNIRARARLIDSMGDFSIIYETVRQGYNYLVGITKRTPIQHDDGYVHLTKGQR